jgi:hypothetical protein
MEPWHQYARHHPLAHEDNAMTKLISGRRRSRQPKSCQRRRGIRLQLESLERRDLPSAPVHISGLTPWPNTSDTQGDPYGVNSLNSEVEPSIAADPSNPEHLVGVWQQDRWSDGGCRGIMAGVSTDGGKSWTTLAIPGLTVNTGGTLPRASDPWVTIAPDGTVYVSSLGVNANQSGQTVYVSRSSDGGFSWAPPTALLNDPDPLASNDKDTITADPTNSNYVYCVWDSGLATDDSFDTIIAPAVFSRSTDGGQTWEAPRIIYTPPENVEAFANQIVVLPNGTLLDEFNYLPDSTTSTIMVMYSTDHGATWSDPMPVASDEHRSAVDADSPGQVLRSGSGIPSIAVDRHSGAVYTVWQDRRFGDGSYPSIALSQSLDGGFTWSTPVQVNQTYNFVPTVDQQAFAPQVAVADNGFVAVTYYDFRFNTSDPGLSTDYWATILNPGSLTVREEQRITSTSFDAEVAPAAGGLMVGDYMGLVAGGSSFNNFASFFEATVSQQNPTDILFAAIEPTPPSTLSLDPSGFLTYSAGINVDNDLTVSASGGRYTFHEVAAPIELSPEAIAAGWTGNGTKIVSGPVASVSQMNIYLGDGMDSLTLEQDFCPTFVSDFPSASGDGADTVSLGDFDGAFLNAQGVTAPITVSNLAPGSTIAIFDLEDQSRAVTVTDNSIAGLSPGGVQYSALGAGSFIDLICGSQLDSVNVDSTAPGVTTVISGATSTTIGNAGSLAGIQGEVRIHAFNQTHSILHIDDSADTQSRSVTSSFVAEVNNPSFVDNNSIVLSGLAPADILYEVARFPVDNNGQKQTQNANLEVTVDLGLGTDLYQGFATNVYLSVHGNGADDTLVLNPLPAGATLTAPLALVDLEGGEGDDLLWVQAASGPVTLAGNGGNDTFAIGDLNNSLDSILGLITVHGGGGSDTLVINDQGASTAHTYAVTPSTIDRTGTATINYSQITDLVVNASNGGNIFKIGQAGQFPMGLPGDPIQINAGSGTNAINVFSTWAPTTINGQTGTNAVYVGSQGLLTGILAPLTLTSTGGSMAVTLDDSADPSAANVSMTSTSIVGLASSIIYYPPNPCTVAVLGGFGGNVFNIYSASVTTSLNPGAGNDLVHVFAASAPLRINDPTLPGFGGTDQVSLGANGDLSGIMAPVTVTSPSGPSTLTVDDRADPTTRVATIDNNTLTGLTPQPITWNAATTSSVIINAGSGGNTFDVMSLGAGIPITIQAGTGGDRIAIGSALSRLDPMLAPLNVVGTGNTILDFNDMGGDPSATPSHQYNYVLTQNSFNRGGMASTTFSGLATVSLHAANALGSSFNTLNVQSSALGTSYQVYAGTGENLFYAFDLNYSLNGIQGRVFFHGAGGFSPNDDAVFIDDVDKTTHHTFAVNAGATPQSGMVQRYNQAGTQSDMAAISYDGLNAYATLYTAGSVVAWLTVVGRRSSPARQFTMTVLSTR